MSKGKKTLKVIGIIFGSLIALIIAVHIILNIVFGIQLHNKIAELKAQGRPMTIAEILPPAVPDEENAALLYNKAFILMTTGEGGKPYIPNKDGGVNNRAIKTITGVKSFSDISQWTDEQRDEIPKLINSRDIQYIYEILEEGSRKPKCNFNHNYEDGPGTLLPELNSMRNTVRLLCVKALLEAESGKTKEAFDTLLVGLKVSNHLKDEPIVLSQLVRVACDGIIIECIENISGSKEIPVEKATLIMDELSIHQDIEPFIKCMDGERVGGVWTFERILRGKARELQEVSYNDPPLPVPLIFIVSVLGKPIFKKDFACYLTFISKMQDSYNIPYYEYVKDRIEDADVPKCCILTRISLPALDRVRELQARHQADIDICRTGLALKLYKTKNGNYPEKLESLAPEFLKEVPTDPFSGKSLKYSRYISGFKLYSIGPNMQDDLGTPRAKKDNEPAFNDYDIVWESKS